MALIEIINRPNNGSFGDRILAVVEGCGKLLHARWIEEACVICACFFLDRGKRWIPICQYLEFLKIFDICIPT